MEEGKNTVVNKINFFLIILTIFLLLLLIYTLVAKKNLFEKPYYVVYLETGDLYFGKLSRFPKFTLSDVWLLQRVQGEYQQDLSLAKFEKAIYEPEDKMEINRSKVVFMAKLKNTSQLVQSIKNAEKEIINSSLLPPTTTLPQPLSTPPTTTTTPANH
ncbi:MAG: hypothetical protein WC042_01305 [Candidatus Paceibacterota bacterium]|jgi:hypothetical protein|nr:hypothetical protein [Candidatus Paceibacterota bacterium]MDD5545326.1 hypothetical protein [Candidatus Paceibacterota bacterium]